MKSNNLSQYHDIAREQTGKRQWADFVRNEEIHGRAKIWEFSSSVQLDILRVTAANERYRVA